MLPSPQVLAYAYRLAVREKPAAEAAELAVGLLPDDAINVPTGLAERVTALPLDSDRPRDDAIAELVAETRTRSIPGAR